MAGRVVDVGGQAVEVERWMSDLDRGFLERADLSATKVAGLMGKTRQAVSKGVAGERDYFIGQDLAQLTEAVDKAYPDRTPVFRAAVGEMFETLAERLGGGGNGGDLATAIGAAERIWLIFPRFATSYEAQKAAYDDVLAAINLRRPGSERELSDSVCSLEVAVFCDRSRASIERLFADSWFDTESAYFIECNIVDKMSPIIIIDQHLDGQSACYSLVMKGFWAVEPREAEAMINAFGAHVTDKMREAEPDRPGRPIDAQKASVAELSSIGVQKI